MIHTNTMQKAAGASNTNGLHTDTNGANFLTAGTDSKDFKTLVTSFARAGHTLTRSNPADGAAMYYAGRWGLSRALPDLQAAAQFLAQIGGGNV